MSYTYLQEQGEESSAVTFSDIPPSVLSRLNLTAERFSSSVNETESSQGSQSGMMSQPLTEGHGEEKSMSCAGDSLAKTSVAPGGGRVSTESEVDCGQKWPESLAKYDPDSRSWKTHQCLLFEDSTESLETLPRWGMTRGGELFPLQTPAHLIEERESGFLPTPRAAMWKNRRWWARHYKKEPKGNLEELPVFMPKQFLHLAGMEINPEWLDWTMGFPNTWTGLKPLEMPKFQSWQQQHGGF
jgi:hypothetical protein